jgi:hypothetical protein
MTENKTVTLIAPNGQTVSVDESKLDARLAAGYSLPEEPPKSSKSTKK